MNSTAEFSALMSPIRKVAALPVGRESMLVLARAMGRISPVELFCEKSVKKTYVCDESIVWRSNLHGADHTGSLQEGTDAELNGGASPFVDISISNSSPQFEPKRWMCPELIKMSTMYGVSIHPNPEREIGSLSNQCHLRRVQSADLTKPTLELKTDGS